MNDNNEKIIAYKGFDKDLKCRGMQYTIGQTHTVDGNIQVCSNGLHACEYPLDVFGYYQPCESRYAVVEQYGEIDHHDGDTKIASASLTVTAEINLPEMVSDAIEWITSRTKASDAINETGDRSAASNTGYRSAASVSGTGSVAMATGRYSRAMACEGSALVLCYRNGDDELINIKSAIAGRDGIKPDIWYTLDADGEFVEWDES